MCKKAESLDFCINDINKESIRILDEYDIPYTAKLICVSPEHQEPIFTTNTFDKSIIVNALFNDKDSYLKALSILNEHNRGDEDSKMETSKLKVDFKEACEEDVYKIIRHRELKKARNTILLFVVDMAIKIAINVAVSRIVRVIIKKYKKEK